MQASKPYQIIFENRPEYLYAFVTADEDTYDISVAFWREVAQHCREVECEKILVEEDIPKNDISTFEMYQFVNDVVSELLSLNVAFVDTHIDQMEANKFAELVATNRGMSVKVFNNFDEAEKWLLSI